jgi:ABC-type molybdenum transport system ATPase subunit/photorepair protein PhrA
MDTIVSRRLFSSLQRGRKRNLWGELAGQLPEWGRKIGWVPDNFPFVFFSGTVAGEIAGAAAAVDNKIGLVRGGLRRAAILLRQMELTNLSRRNPFQLSQGESKLVWFLCQWAKSPDYLVIGHVPTSLSARRVADLVTFLKSASRLATAASATFPTLILGYTTGDLQWYQDLLTDDYRTDVEVSAFEGV